MNVYLDIDLVLLVDEYHTANYAHEFLEYLYQNYRESTFWLTTHCRGNAKTAVERLSKVFKPETMKLIQDIKPTNWSTAKTEAIDFSQPFITFDDDLFDDEREELIKHGVLDNWVLVDLRKDPNQLQKFITSFPLPVQAI